MSGKSPLRREDETMENRRALARVFSSLMGSPKRLEQQALDGHIAGMSLQIPPLSLSAHIALVDGDHALCLAVTEL